MGLTVVPGNMIEDGTVTDSNFDNTTITSDDMALDPRNASNMSSGSVPLAQLGNIPAIDLTGLDDDIALLGFKTAANGSLAKYNLLDQTVDAFEDASGVDAGSSTNEIRDSSGKYYSGVVTVPGNATGGTVTTHGSYTVNTFLTSSNFIVPGGSGNVDVLVVAGGGGGMHGPAGGGGGAGGVRTGNLALTAQTYAVTVGAGGAGNANGSGNFSGADSVFSTITSTGGGAGGYQPATAPSGGSGGGGAYQGPGGAGNTPSTSPAQGYPGGDGTYPAQGGNSYSGGGGGGAGAPGTHATWQSHAGPGGDGIQNDYRTGSNVYYGGGGGGVAYNYPWPGGSPWRNPGTGGQGGGGDGGLIATVTQSPYAGTDNTGGGGGGGYNSGAGAGSPGNASGSGGSGIVVVRYTTNTFQTDGVGNMTLVSTATTAQAVPTKGDMVMTYTNGAGTAVINTNIKGYVSRDGGTTYTQGTLALQGTTGGHTILSFHDLDISGQPSGSSMRYKIETLVQSASMDTRIQAVSLGWS